MTLYPSHFRKRLFGPWLATLFFCASAVAADPSALDEAVKALDDGVVEVAIVKLQQELAKPLDPAVRSQAKAKMAEALFAAGRTDDALRQVSDPEVKAPLLQARIQAAAGNWEAALALYSTVPESSQAIMGKAECLHALGKQTEAIMTLESIEEKAPPCVSLRLGEYYLEAKKHDKCLSLLKGLSGALSQTERKWKQYLEAHLLLVENNPAAAYERFEALQRDPRYVSAEMVVGATLGMTESRSELTGLTAADDILEQFIWKHPDSPYLAALFRKLDEVYGGEENPSPSELLKWSERDPAIRAGYATFYLAKALARDEKTAPALNLLEKFSQRFPSHPLLSHALLLRGRLLADTGAFDLAQKALDEAMRSAPAELRAEIEMATASTHFKAGQYVLAATHFRNAGDRNPALAETTRFNIALSWLYQGNYVRFHEDSREFSQLFPASQLRSDLALEEGLLRARRGDTKAEAVLERYLQDFSSNPRVSEARLALAELFYSDKNLQSASQFLQVVNALPAPTKTAEQSDYLAIFVADAAAPPNEEKVIALCRAFIGRYPASRQLDRVRMKLGQVFFHAGDFANAQTQLETIAIENPTSPLLEQALFLAGQASTKRIDEGGIDRAIQLFNDVAARPGPLKLYARLQIALLQNRLGKEDDAVKLYDDILRANPTGEVKFSAMAGKADNLFALGAKDKAACEQALALYEQLANEPGIDATMQHRALYNKGRCMETLERPEEALSAYYKVVESGSAKPVEYFWFYKAGFDACHLCESREQWKSAITIYQKMAALAGPRAEEAKARMSQLRLEHFIWE